MRVKVQPMNVNWRALFRSERDRREIFVGELNVYEIRVPRFERAVTQAPIIEVCEEPTWSSVADPGMRFAMEPHGRQSTTSPSPALGMARTDRKADSPNRITP
jgi:hypothetical protein